MITEEIEGVNAGLDSEGPEEYLSIMLVKNINIIKRTDARIIQKFHPFIFSAKCGIDIIILPVCLSVCLMYS